MPGDQLLVSVRPVEERAFCGRRVREGIFSLAFARCFLLPGSSSLLTSRAPQSDVCARSTPACFDAGGGNFCVCLRECTR